MSSPRRYVAPRAGLRAISKDRVMRGLVARNGACGWDLVPPFRAIVRSIIGQQVSNSAARTIFARFRELFGMRPRELVRVAPERLREAGLSGRKAEYVHGLARAAQAGALRGLGKLDDDAIIARLTELRGVGRWTAEMFLIFSLGREDVWPLGDAGIVATAGALYATEDLAAVGERFRPWRSLAAWYLWAAVDG